MRPTPEKVTLKLIAERAGTSIGTVDRALSNRPGINQKTKDHILSVARDLGYRPNKFASALSRKRIIRLGIVYPTVPDGFYHYIDQGVDRAIQELTPYGVQIEKLRYLSQNLSDQADLLQSLDTNAYDGLAINAAGPLTVSHINAISLTGTPVITFNTDAAESSRLFFIGNDSLQSGRMGAELLGRMLGGSGNVTVLGNFAQVTPFSERFAGFCDVIHNEFPDIALYPCAECYSKSSLAAKNLIETLTQVPNMRGVFCTGYSSTVGAITALKTLKRKDIVLIGYDVGEEIFRGIAEGYCDAILFQDPYRQSYEAAHALVRNILEGWLPTQPKLHIETQIVLKQNMESYRTGVVRWDLST